MTSVVTDWARDSASKPNRLGVNLSSNVSVVSKHAHDTHTYSVFLFVTMWAIWGQECNMEVSHTKTCCGVFLYVFIILSLPFKMEILSSPVDNNDRSQHSMNSLLFHQKKVSESHLYSFPQRISLEKGGRCHGTSSEFKFLPKFASNRRESENPSMNGHPPLGFSMAKIGSLNEDSRFVIRCHPLPCLHLFGIQSPGMWMLQGILVYLVPSVGVPLH